MCTSSEMSVTVNSIITDRPSASVPSSKWTPSTWNQVMRSTTGPTGVTSSPVRPTRVVALLIAPETRAPETVCSGRPVLGWVLAAATAETGTLGGSLTRWIHWIPAQLDSTKQMPTAPMPMAEQAFSGSRLPISRMSDERHRHDGGDHPDVRQHEGIGHV